MSDLPPPAPAGVLIRDARKMAIPRRSIPEVAHAVGIDPGTLGNIERGYRHLGDGRVRAVRADPAILAKLARELGIPPERVERQGERPDAADIMRREARGDRTPPPRLAAVDPPASPPDPRREVFGHVVSERALTLFDGDLAKALIWEAGELDDSDEGRELTTELMRTLNEFRAGKKSRREGTGLPGAYAPLTDKIPFSGPAYPTAQSIPRLAMRAGAMIYVRQ